MKKILHILFFIFLFSCKKEEIISSVAPYLKFGTNANEWLTEIKLNQTIELNDSNGNTRVYFVYNILKSKEKVEECSSLSGNCITYFEYDNLEITFKRIDSHPVSNYPVYSMVKLYMWIPDSVYYKNVPQDLIPITKLIGQFDDYNILPAPPAISSFLNFPKLDSIISTTSFSNTVKTYSEVIKLFSNNNAVYINPTNNAQNTINEIWFDKKYGFVQLKDIDGTIWKRTN